MPDQPLPNSPETRTPEGTIKDQQTPPTTATPPEPTPTTAPTPDKSLSPSTEPASDKALVNKDLPKPPVGAPEKYVDFKVPDGYELDKPIADEAGKIFKEMNLTQDQAQKLVDFYAGQQIKDANKPYDLYTQMRDGWRTEILKDPHFGDGTSLLPEVKANIGRVIDSLGPDLAGKFREAMDLTGAGDHPAFLRAFTALATQLTEGRPVPGRGPSPAGQVGTHSKPESAAKALFPNLP